MCPNSKKAHVQSLHLPFVLSDKAVLMHQESILGVSMKQRLVWNYIWDILISLETCNDLSEGNKLSNTFNTF